MLALMFYIGCFEYCVVRLSARYGNGGLLIFGFCIHVPCYVGSDLEQSKSGSTCMH